MSRSLCVIAMACALLWSARPASADDKAEAEKHFKAGISLLRGDDFSAAVAALAPKPNEPSASSEPRRAQRLGAKGIPPRNCR